MIPSVRDLYGKPQILPKEELVKDVINDILYHFLEDSSKSKKQKYMRQLAHDTAKQAILQLIQEHYLMERT